MSKRSLYKPSSILDEIPQNFIMNFFLAIAMNNGKNAPLLISAFQLELVRRLSFGSANQNPYAQKTFSFLGKYLMRKILPTMNKNMKVFLQFFLAKLSWKSKHFPETVCFLEKAFYPKALFLLDPKSLKKLRILFMECVSTKKKFALEFTTCEKKRISLKFDCSDGKIRTLSATVTNHYGEILKKIGPKLVLNETNGGKPLDTNVFVLLNSLEKQDFQDKTFKNSLIYLFFFYTKAINLRIGNDDFYGDISTIMFYYDEDCSKRQRIQ